MKHIYIIFISILLTNSILFGFDNNNTVYLNQKSQLLNIAGRQRMLSQRIAKDYLYKGRKIATSKAEKQLTQSFAEFTKNYKYLLSSISDPEIVNLLSFVQLSSEEFNDLIKKPFTLDNAQLALDLSESMLEGSQYVVNSIKKKFHKKESKIVDMSGKQRMLAQRIAKYYISYQAGIKDKNSIEQMQKAVKTFTLNLKELTRNSKNTPTINQKLSQVTKLWTIVYKFYLNIEKGGLPFIVYTTTDDITKKMDEITKLYVKLYK